MIVSEDMRLKTREQRKKHGKIGDVELEPGMMMKFLTLMFRRSENHPQNPIEDLQLLWF